MLSCNIWLAVADTRGSRFSVLVRENVRTELQNVVAFLASSDVLLLLLTHLIYKVVACHKDC
jgi:hypothetical protein